MGGDLGCSRKGLFQRKDTKFRKGGNLPELSFRRENKRDGGHSSWASLLNESEKSPGNYVQENRNHSVSQREGEGAKTAGIT